MFLTPRWIVSHVFVAVLIVSFVIAGFWQLSRLEERRSENALIESRMGTVVDYETARAASGDDLEYTRLQVRGTFDADAEILIANRSDEGTPGFWIWTNFVTDQGDDLIVNRGFIERSVIQQTAGAPPLSEADATPGSVLIEGLVRRGLDDGRITEAGDQLSRPDAALAASRLGIDPALGSQVYLELRAQDPARESNIPRPVPPPDLGEGSHGSYAFQWFTFATIGVIGYGATLARIRRGDQMLGDVPHEVDPRAGAPGAAV